MNPAREVVRADVLVTDGRIAAVGEKLPTPPATRLLEAEGLHVLPGLIQGHVHLGQALFRGLAEERELLPWLRDRIWPLEAAHTEESAYWSALLGAADCLLAGTTTVQDIGIVKEMEGLYRGIRDSGLRAAAGKCLMDSGEGAPPELIEEPAEALEETRELHRRWHGAARGRITTVLCPRFILSCSDSLWERTVATADALQLPIHTHLLESPEEAEAVRAAVGTDQMTYLDRLGVLDRDLRIAHGVCFDEAAAAVLADRPLKVAHCPSANLKLGSGIADLVFLRDRENVALGIGCDGAPCNNDMDVLEEIRLAALLQAWKQGPGRFSSLEALETATIGGARAIGMQAEIGSIEPGKMGDILVLDLNRPATFGPDRVSVYDRVVFSAARDAVRWVMVDGEIVVDRGKLPHLDENALARRPEEEILKLVRRTELA